MRGTLPHPIPYQGSKRNLAADILRYFPKKFDTLYEPFAGSAAITIAAAAIKHGKHYHISDMNKALMELWRQIIEEPEQLSEAYKNLWEAQQEDPKAFFFSVREQFNKSGDPKLFLYILARIVKGAVRYNSKGGFSQSADNRRLGMKPGTMDKQLLGVSKLLKGKTTVSSVDYRDLLSLATADDLVYMDPPYQGVCGGRDHRYYQGVDFDDFVDALADLNRRNVRFIVSYDGRTGDKVFGKVLPDKLNLTLIELVAGRSSQATLLGRDDITIESLYLSHNLSEELSLTQKFYRYKRAEQLCLLEDQIDNNRREAAC